jgi:hypothetical protein
MQTGKTMSGIDASGAMVIVYYKDKDEPLFLMGQETIYLTESKNLGDFKSKENEGVHAGFLIKGSMNNEADVIQARRKFTRLCKELEDYSKTHVTYGDMKNSSKAGYISAKPRCVADKNKTKYGFPKGGFEQNVDKSVNHTAIRECRQETSVELDIKRLVETEHLIASGSKNSYYKIYLYNLTKIEYDEIYRSKLLETQNADYENELHNVCFKRIPNINFRDFFINTISRVAYEKIISKKNKPALGEGSKAVTRKVESKYVKNVLISSRKNAGNWFNAVFKK